MSQTSYGVSREDKQSHPAGMTADSAFKYKYIFICTLYLNLNKAATDIRAKRSKFKAHCHE